jgi:hypothetical protein
MKIYFHKPKMGNTSTKKIAKSNIDLVMNFDEFLSKDFEFLFKHQGVHNKITSEQFIDFIIENAKSPVDYLNKICIKFRKFRKFSCDMIEILNSENKYKCSFISNNNIGFMKIYIVDKIIKRITSLGDIPISVVIVNIEVLGRQIPLFLMKESKEIETKIKLVGKKDKYCTIQSTDPNSFKTSYYYNNLIYKNTEDNKFEIVKCKEKVKNTFISFEDMCRMNDIAIPFFWKLNYLPVYKKMREIEEELFETNVFKSIVEYI